MTWARALGEFGATITFAGDIQGRTQTLPLAVYLGLQENEHVAVALSLALLAISVVVLVSLRGRWLGAINRDPRRRGGSHRRDVEPRLRLEGPTARWWRC